MSWEIKETLSEEELQRGLRGVTLDGLASKATITLTSGAFLVALGLMVFVLIYVPCLAVIATVRKETNSWKWPLFLIGYTCALAWIVSFILYQGGRLLGF